jgi:hypothetical protein
MADNNPNQQPQADPPVHLGEGTHVGSTESLGTLSPPTVDYDSDHVRFR